MASSIVDLVKINVTSLGTGALTLGAAVPGYRGVEVLTSGRDYGYSIQQGNNFEFGRGTYLAASSQLIRSPIGSSLGGTAINLAPNAQVAFVVLASDLNPVQLTADAQAAAITATTKAAQTTLDAAAVSAGVNNLVNGQRVFPYAYASALPQGVTSLSTAGVGTGTGGTAGTYAGGVSGGPTGFTWQYTIDGTGKIGSYSIVSKGLATATTAPTLTYPSGGVTGATVPVATVSGIVLVSETYWAATSDSKGVALWQNTGTGSPVAVLNPDATQIIYANKAYLDAAIAGIPTSASLTAGAAAATNKAILKVAAGKWGQGSFVQRSSWIKGQTFTGAGGTSASPNLLIVPNLPCSGTQGVGCTQEEYGTTRTQLFKDASGAAICFNLALFTATFVSGSPNFTVTAWRQGGPGLLPPGAPSPLTGFGTSDPLMTGMQLFADTGGNAIIPANAIVGNAGATPYSTSTVYTMVDPTGTPLNAASSGTVNVQTGGQFPGTPIIPPPGYNAVTVDFQLTYAGSYGISQNPDDLDFYPFNFANVAEMRSVGGSANTRVLRSSHYAGYGLGDEEQRAPLLGRNGGALGNSALLHETWTKTVALETRSRIFYRGGLGGRQTHQFLDGIATSGTGTANWNGPNPTNLNGAAVAADFVGLDYMFIGTCGPNDQGYSNGSGGLIANGGGAAGGGQQPYTIGSITESGAGFVANVTANGTTTLVVNSFTSKSALNPTLIGLKFPTTASFGLAGRTIAGGPTNGLAGTYTLDSAAGVGSGTGTMMVGSYLGSMNWMLSTLLAYNATNVGRMLPIIVDPCPRFDLGSSNGGITTGTWDLVNLGNPICASTGLRLSDFYDGNTLICRKWGLPRLDLFTKGGFNAFTAAALYNPDFLHLFDAVPAPIGDRAFGQQASALLNSLFPIL